LALLRRLIEIGIIAVGGEHGSDLDRHLVMKVVNQRFFGLVHIGSQPLGIRPEGIEIKIVLIEVCPYF